MFVYDLHTYLVQVMASRFQEHIRRFQEVLSTFGKSHVATDSLQEILKRTITWNNIASLLIKFYTKIYFWHIQYAMDKMYKLGKKT